MRTYFPGLLALIVGVFCSSRSFAFSQADSSTSNALRRIARQMFLEHNHNFILAQMLTDGVLRDGDSYDILYRKKEFLLNGEKLEEPYHGYYVGMMLMYQKDDRYGFSMKGERISISQLLDPSSSYRKLENMDSINAAFRLQEKQTDTMVAQMIDDRIVREWQPVLVECDAKGLHVNGEKLPAELDARYMAILRKIYRFDMTAGKNSIRLARDAERLK